jgi:hypothetical protein
MRQDELDYALEGGCADRVAPCRCAALAGRHDGDRLCLPRRAGPPPRCRRQALPYERRVLSHHRAEDNMTGVAPRTSASRSHRARRVTTGKSRRTLASFRRVLWVMHSPSCQACCLYCTAKHALKGLFRAPKWTAHALSRARYLILVYAGVGILGRGNTPRSGAAMA